MSFRKIICHSGICRQGCNLLASTLVPMSHDSHDPRIHPATASWNCIKFCTSVPFPWKIGGSPQGLPRSSGTNRAPNLSVTTASLPMARRFTKLYLSATLVLWNYGCYDICVMTFNFTLTKLKLCLHSKVYNSAYFMIFYVPICPIFQWHERPWTGHPFIREGPTPVLSRNSFPRALPLGPGKINT